MENPQEPGVSGVQRERNRSVSLHLDNVVASQPEIGPTPPDGGYGWLIVVSAVMYHITVPTLLSLYGLMILKGIREDDSDENDINEIRLWDADVALVPFILVVIKLLMESWCRAVVKIFNMPRFMAVSGLCLTVAGVLLSSYSTDDLSTSDMPTNDHIVSIFSGIFAGLGCALTGQQTDIIITHYFRDKLTIAQRLVRMAPSVGNCLIPILVGYLCTLHTADVVVHIYGAVVMQNCLFLASYSRPVYIERVIKTTYNMIRDAMEDEDEIVFNRNRENRQENETGGRTNSGAAQNPDVTTQDEDDIVVYNSRTNAREVVDSTERTQEYNDNDRRFSSDFSNAFTDDPLSRNSHRFSSDFGSLDITNYARGYRELDNIDRESQNPQPLYRETTVDAPDNLVFPAEIPPGTARRTASLRKNVITLKNVLLDINFYLYALLHLCTTFSILVLGVVFAPHVWILNPTMNIWSVSLLIAVAHGSALCFIMLCIALPKSINEKARLCAVFCAFGSLGFFGITFTANKSLLVIWCMFASFATAASHILQQPLYNSTLNDFDVTATMTASNTLVAAFILIWSLARNYEFKTCFFTASILQTITAVVFLLASFRRRR
ncbi:hypothetical protein O0L34_g5259 [Tuta absoluta]|nr:hypothetical protein O0L34_g5259 [Tuta absoluta]